MRISKALQYLFLALFIPITGFMIGYTLFYFLGTPRVSRGVYLDGHHLGGMTEKEVRSFLTALDRSLRREDIVLEIEGGEGSYVIEPSDIGFGLDIDGLTGEIMTVGRSGSLIERLKFRIPFFAAEKRLVSRPWYDGEKLKSLLEDIAGSVYIPPKEPEPDLGEEVIRPEVVGRHLVFDEAFRRIDRTLMERGGGRVSLPVEELHPAMKLKDLQSRGILRLISRYSTQFDPERTDRVENIRLSASKIHGVILEPGESFSFNEVVGPRTRELGYREAPEIVKNRLVIGVGGGVCQVSSTLYNAVLLGGLKVTERRNHSIPLDYIRMGRDATVYYPTIDLKFENSLDRPVMLASKVEGNRLIIGIFGTKEEGLEYRLATSPVEVIERGLRVEHDPSLEEDEVVKDEGADGYRVSLFRETYRHGRIIFREEVSKSYYPPRERVIKVKNPQNTTEPEEGARLD